jgi:excinuclease ABC subunit A
MGRTPRSIPLTYLDIYTPLRKLMAGLPAAKRLGLEAAHFSFNTAKGRCPHCEGSGRERIELLFFEDVFVPCDHCGAKRFKAEVLAVRYEGRNIHDIMELTVDEAFELFNGIKKMKTALALLIDMGLGYLLLGQSALTLSGGEAQRLKICAELLGRRKAPILYLMDEPTTGMHGEDVDKLMGVVERLVDRGDTVIVVEHNLSLISRADWVVDLGPEGGDAGGLVVDAGTPEEVAGRALGPTGQYLAKYYSRRKTHP